MPVKAQVTGTLERQIAHVALRHHAVFPSGNVQLKPVAAVKLERYVIVSGGAGVHTAVVIAVVVHIGILPLGDNSRLHRQARRIVVLVPGANALYC